MWKREWKENWKKENRFSFMFGWKIFVFVAEMIVVQWITMWKRTSSVTCCAFTCNSCSSDLGADPSICGAGILKIESKIEN